MQGTAETLPEMRLNGEPAPMRGAPRELWSMPEKPDAVRHDPPEHIEPPGYGDSSRDAVKAIVVGMSEQNGKALAALRAELDEMEQLMLISAAKMQHEIDGHASVCRYVHNETERLHGLVAKMRQQQSEIVHVTEGGERARASA